MQWSVMTQYNKYKIKRKIYVDIIKAPIRHTYFVPFFCTHTVVKVEGVIKS